MSIHARLFKICALIALCCPSLLSQVEVNVSAHKSDYLVGEPVFVVVEVKNIGTEPVGYGKGWGRVHLTIKGIEKKVPRRIGNCFRGAAFESSGGIGVGFHPPLLKTGDSISFQYLLEDYALQSGDYTLHGKGEAAVVWTDYPFPGPNPPPPPKRFPGEPVPGKMFGADLPLSIREGSKEELQRRFVPLVEDASDNDWERRSRGREAIAEMAPEFLEKTILGFAEDPNYAHLAVEGLGRIHNSESREDLMELFDKSADLKLRARIVLVLARMATPDLADFFFSLLPGRSTTLDDEIRQYAALGLGQIGGDEMVERLKNAPRSPNPEVRGAILIGLGNTRSPRALPALFDLYASDATNLDTVCGTLASATHLTWCDGSGRGEDQLAEWRSWWQRNGQHIRLFGPDECPEQVIGLPYFEKSTALDQR